ncbi:MAG: histidine kinase [Sediminibacterium sp.]|nr:histidine kinase [Sediminibacterium sp.]
MLLNQSFAQRDIVKVPIRKFTQGDGLSSYYVTKIIQDSYGFFWIGTQEGANRFDGKNFSTYSRQSSLQHQLGGSNVTDIIEDRKRNMMWVSTSYGDVCGIDINSGTIVQRITNDEQGHPFSDRWIRSICLQGDILWIGISNGICAYDIINKHFLTLSRSIRSLSLPTANVSLMTTDSQARLWALCDDYGAICIDNKMQAKLAFSKQQIQASVYKEKSKLRFLRFFVKNNHLYMATSNGLRILSLFGDGRLLEPTHTLIDSMEITGISSFGKDKLLFSANKKFGSYDPTIKKIVYYRDAGYHIDDWFGFVQQSFYDSSAQKIWIGTQEGIGYFTNEIMPFTGYFQSNDKSVKLKHLYSLLPENDSLIYCGDESGLFSININDNSIRQIGKEPRNLMLFKTRDKKILLSNLKGFYILEKDKLVPVGKRMPYLAPLENDFINCGLQFNDSVVFFSSFIQKGLYMWNTNTNRLTVYHTRSSNNPVKNLDIINHLYKNKSGSLFVLTEKEIIDFNPATGRYRNNVILTGKGKETFNNFMDMTETSDSYWIATYGNGLVQTDKKFNVKHTFTKNSGLGNDCVYKVFSITDSSIITTSNYGLSLINGGNGQITNFFESDGLQSSQFEEFCGIYNEGKIYAGGVNGFSVIAPLLIKKNTVAPKLYFGNIKIEQASGTTDTSNLLMKEIKIPSNYLRVNILFSALNYANPSRINYAFRTDNNEWVQLGSRNFIDLMGMAPGTYRLQAKASNEDNVWNEKPTELKLIILPKWHQTWWFKIAILIVIAGVFYLAYRNKIKQQQKQQQIRQDIASDLHDDIGSTLNALKVYTHLAETQPGKGEYLKQIQSSIAMATTGLRDMIWVLDDTDDTVYGLAERISKILAPLANAQGISFTITVKESLREMVLGKTEKRNLLLIAKESINNVIKYANAQNINITIDETAGKMNMCIADDGAGFELSLANTGNGLRNIRQRCTQMKYVIDIITTPGNGTIIKLVKS